jgi:ABC-type dipeptide/oligopeptide/nickel transport system permease component
MKMWVYIIRRVLLLVPVILGVMTITFALSSALPINDRLISAFGYAKNGYKAQVPCTQLGINQSGTCRNPAYYNAIHRLGLDQPIWTQYGTYISNALTLHWGYTSANGPETNVIGKEVLPVATVLSWYLPFTLELAALSLAIILLLAVPIGNYSAVYRNRPLDQGARVMSFSGFALPGYLLGTILLLAVVFAAGGITPTCNGFSTPYSSFTGSWPANGCWPNGGSQPSWIGDHLQSSPTGFPTIDALIHGQYWLAGDTVFRLLLPAFVIAYGSIAAILRFVRNSMLEVLNLDFVRTARAKGVAEGTVVRKHAGRNSLNVTVTVLGLTFAGFIGGFPVIETVFQLRGVGLLLALSIQPPFDFGLIFGSTLLFTIIVVIANILVDITYAFLDPRVRLG